MTNMNIKIKHIGKKIIITISIFLMFTMNTAPSFGAVETGKELLCARDWLTFISSVISYDGFTEYWKDIFYRYNKNICYYFDIDSLLKQIDKAREQIRNAFYTCDAARANSLKNRYYELEAELFFLRNFINIPQSEVMEIEDEKVYSKLRDNFVINKSYFDDDKAKELFDKFKKDYKDRVKTYKDCKDPGIEMLINKWNSLKKSFKEMGDTGKSIKDHWEKSINAPNKRTGEFLGGFLDMRLNNLPIKKSAELIYNEIKKNLPTGGTPTLEDLQFAIDINEEEYSKKVEQTSLIAEYEALFKHGGDALAKDFEDKIKELNKIIEDTYKPLEQLKACAKKTVDRQCK